MEKITSRSNALLVHMKKLAASAAYRREAGVYLCDSPKLLAEALKWNAPVRQIVVSGGVELPPLPDGIRTAEVPEDVMASISPMRSPQGALFTCALPPDRPFVPRRGMLLLDGIQDPGNLGTMLRTADALNVPVVLLEGCADPYSHKVVRASMGAVFRTPVVRAGWETVRRECARAGIDVAVTALSDRARDIRQAELSEMAVVIGSEGQGVRREILEQADAELIIPMNSRCESLNAAVAAAIVMWQMVR